MPFRVGRFQLLEFALCALCGCFEGSDDVASESTTRSATALVGGQVDDQASPVFPSTGLLKYDLGEKGVGICTATMLSCSVGITAAHCFCNQGSKLEAIDGGGNLYGQLHAKIDFDVAEHVEAVSGYSLEIAAIEQTGCTGQVQPRDLAVFSLSDGKGNAGKGALQALRTAVIAETGAAVVGAQTIAVGYAGNGTCATLTGEAYPLCHREYGLLPITSVGSMVVAGPHEGVRTAQGDSGGPLFLPSSADGELRIAGILSGQESTHRSFYVHVSDASRRAWIEKAVGILTVDTDGDGVADACDLCPHDSSASGAGDPDSDGDGTPNACDGCPCSPGVTDDKKQGDGDGVCAECDDTLHDQNGRVPDFCSQWCAANPKDNCPTYNNPAQYNCNADAERATNAAVLGDQCDPVPCPAGAPKWADVVTSSQVLPPGPGDIGLIIENHTSRLARFVVKKLLSGAKQKDVALLDSAAYRYCDPGFGVVCKRDAVIDESLLLIPEAEEEVDGIWHIVRARTGLTVNPDPFDDEGFPVDTSLDARDYRCGTSQTPKSGGTGEPEPYCNTHSVYWSYGSDFAKWQARWPGEAPELAPASSGSSEDGGRFWFHVETALGMTNTTSGQHPTLDSSTPHYLANHFEYVAPIYNYVTARALPPLEAIPPFDPLGRIHQCPNCGLHELTLPIDIPFVEHPNEALLLGKVVTAHGSALGFLAPQGGVWDAGTLFDDQVRAALLQPGLLWLSPAEANPMIGRGPGNPATVAITSDGTALSHRLYINRGRLTMGLRVPTVAAFAEPPAARSGFAAVYARSQGRVYLIGGKASGPAAVEAPVLAANLTDGSWMRWPSGGYQPENVLSATYSIADDSLWVVEETAGAQKRWVRIVRIDAKNGSARVFGPWPRFGFSDRLWLSADVEGGILLTASSSKHSRHAILRLRTLAHQIVAERVHPGQGALADAPVVDATGVRIILVSGEVRRLEGLEHPAGPPKDHVGEWVR